MQKYHIGIILALIITGATNTIFLSLENKQRIPEQQSTHNQIFFHPFIQLAMMFLAQTLCFIPYLVFKYCKRSDSLLEVSGFMKKDCPIYLPMIPGFMDLFASGLAYFALNLISSSVWQISRGGVIITTAIFSRIFLHKKFDRNSIVGCILTFTGITVVQVFEITLSEKQVSQVALTQNKTSEQIVGVVLLLISLIFNTITLISEKIIFNKYTINPLKMVFMEGIYGLIGICLVIFALSFFHCPEWGSIHDKCMEVDGQLFIESISVFISQITKNSMLIYLSILFMLSIAISVPIAVTISKVINPLSRTIADVCRTVVIWIFGIIITFEFGDDPQYNLEQKGLALNLCKAAGFLLVIAGTLVYHGAISLYRKNYDVMKESMLLSEDAERNLDKYSNMSDQKLNKSSNKQSLM